MPLLLLRLLLLLLLPPSSQLLLLPVPSASLHFSSRFYTNIAYCVAGISTTQPERSWACVEAQM